MSNSRHYLQSRHVAIIFLSFALLALPLSFLQLSPTVSPVVSGGVFLAYAVLVGNTHFAITWGLYLSSANVRYFESSPGRKVLYFGGPALILAGMATIGVLELPRPGMLIFVPFSLALACVDFYHVVRQSFGVLQLFKARAEALFPPGATDLDNLFFLSLLALQALTFAGGISHGFDGQYDPTSPLTRGVSALAVVLFALVVRNFVSAARQAGADRGALLTAFAYLLLQSASALLVVYRSRLYLASLAMHYVEYHVLMAPRLFQTPLDATTRLDRIGAMFRRHKAVFYGLLVGLSAWVSAGAILAYSGTPIRGDSSQFAWLLINLLNGIFLSHYFIESFVWKFGNPFYRKTLAPLYFGSGAAPTSGAPGQRARRS